MAVWSRVLQDGQVRAMAGVYDLTGRNEKTSPIPEGRSGLRNKANPRERANRSLSGVGGLSKASIGAWRFRYEI